MLKHFGDTGQTLVTKVDARCIKCQKMMAVKNAEAQRNQIKATNDTDKTSRVPCSMSVAL